MKTQIVFDSEVEGDNILLKQHIKANDMAHALWDITHNLKKKLEYRFEATDNSNNDVFDGVDGVFDAIYEILERYNINTEDLID